MQWAPRALYPQPRAYLQQQTDLSRSDEGAARQGRRPERAARRRRSGTRGYNFDLLGRRRDRRDAVLARRVRERRRRDEAAASRTAPIRTSPTIKPTRGRAAPTPIATRRRGRVGLPPVPVGGPAYAAAGRGRRRLRRRLRRQRAPLRAGRHAGGGASTSSKSCTPTSTRVDHEGNTALHHAAARGDNEMILYLVSKGADPKAVNREGQTTVDMANGPVQRMQPFPETIALLESWARRTTTSASRAEPTRRKGA